MIPLPLPSISVPSSRISARRPPVWRALAALFGGAALLGAQGYGANVITQHNDNNRSGLNASESILTPAKVDGAHFGKLFEKEVDGDLYSQPLYVERLKTAAGLRNIVFVSTANNSVYAFDADRGAEPALWTRNLGAAIPEHDAQSVRDIAKVIGIISTGVIDLSTSIWYVISQQKAADATYHQYLHALDLATGKEMFRGPKEISANAGGVNFDAKLNNQRVSLLLQKGKVYAAWSSHNDGGDYHGWVIGFDAATLDRTGAWPATTTPGAKGGIWMSGGGLAGDGENIYASVGNGNFDANSGGNDLGQSIVRLNGALYRQDYFAPSDWKALNGPDTDVGAEGILLIPGAKRLLSGGKNGKWYLVDTAAMGGYDAANDSCLQSFMVTDKADALHHLHGGPCFWNNLIFVGGESNQLKAFRWAGAAVDPKPVSQSSFKAVSHSMPGWQLAISADGMKNGIVWATRPFSGDANNAIQPGILHAFDATDLTRELWNSRQNAARDDFGNFAKGPSVTVANGKVYCPTFSNKLAVYGVLGSRAEGR